jgi:hypothetical protein
MNYGTKFCRLCLKLLLPTILTYSLPFYPYQKDERALPGYLLTRCSFSPSDIEHLLLSPRCFIFSSTLILSFLILSLSLFHAYTGKLAEQEFSFDGVSIQHMNLNTKLICFCGELNFCFKYQDLRFDEWVECEN